MPLELGLRIEEDAPVRLLSQICDELGYGELEKAYTRNGRKLAASPRHLFKIVVFAYMNGIYSSRKIEEACRRDIHFMWLLEGHKAPDHNTIARFRTERLPPAMEGLFYQLVHKLHEKGEISFSDVFVDGTKIEANANRYSFVWKKTVEKQSAKLEPKLTAHMKRLREEYGILSDEPEDVLRWMEELREQQGICFVSGKGKRKTQLQRDYEELQGYLQRRGQYRGYEAIFGGRNSFSKTDTDATFMHMKEDHMRNGQLKPGYNLQIGVEAEYIVGMDLSAERSDVNTLIPLLERMHGRLGQRHKTVTADAGYESEENYVYLEENGQLCFIKPANYEKQKTKKYRASKYLRENMPYDTTTDAYTCPEGRKLVRDGTRKRTYKSGYTAELSVYVCENCEGCGQKLFCTKAKGNREMKFSPKFIAFRERTLRDIQTERGILLRINRSIQVEGAFGVLKQDYGFRRFLLRGKQNVFTETLLMGFAYNVNKLHAKIQSRRLNLLLHEKLIA
jgi:transposase